MARDVESLVLQMSADLRKFEKSMDGMRRTADRRLSEVERRAEQSQKNLSRLTARMGDDMVAGLKSSLAQLAPTIAAAFSAQQVLKYADSYTSLQNRLRAAGLEGAALKKVEDELFVAANRNGLEVAATAELYSRASLSRQRLGASEEQLLALVNGTAAALKVQGTSAAAASGPLLQLGQALSGTNVQAEEYNSLIDGLPVLLQAAAKGSDRFGGDVAKLTELVKAGKVTSQEFFQALLKGFPEIEKQAAGSATTIASALQTLDNQLGRYVGQTDASLGATARMAQGIEGLANNLDQIIPVIGVLVALIGGRLVWSIAAASGAMISATASNAAYQLALAGLAARQGQVVSANVLAATTTRSLATAQIVATGATRTFTAALAANPIGAVVIAVAALAAGLAYLSAKYGEASVLQREQTAVTDGASKAIAAYRKAAEEAATATGTHAAAARANAEAMRLEALQAVRAAQALQQRRQALLQQRVAEAQKEASDISRSVGPGQTTLNQGQYAAAQSRVRIAQQAYEEARTDATAKTAELNSLERDIRTGQLRPLSVAGPRANGSGSTGGATAISAEADKLDKLRRELASLQDDLLTDTERATKELAARLATIEAAVSEKLLTPEQAERLRADLMGQDIRPPEAAALDDFDFSAVQDLARAIQDGADELERGYREAGDLMARDIVDVLASGNIWEAAGYKFREAAFDGLQALLSDVFTSLFRGQASGEGGLGASIVKGIGSLFGKRALGGPARAGQPIVVGERRPEVFVPDVNGTVIPSVNAAMAQANRVRGGAQTVHHIVTVVPDRDSFIQLAADTAQPMAEMARAGAVGDVAAAQAVSNRRAQLRTRR